MGIKWIVFKPFNIRAIRALSDIIRSAAPSVLYLIKHPCSQIKYYILHTLYYIIPKDLLISPSLNNLHIHLREVMQHPDYSSKSLTLSIFSWACCWNFLKLFSVETELETGVKLGTPGEPAEPKPNHDVVRAFESCRNIIYMAYFLYTFHHNDEVSV